MNEKVVKGGIQILTKMPEISIKAEKIFSIGGFPVTNSLISSFVVLIFFLVFALIYKNNSKLKRTASVQSFLVFNITSLPVE